MNMTKEEYDAMPIEEKPMYVAMVDRGDGYVLHHVCQNGYFASEKGLMMALGGEDIAIFKLEFQCKTFKPFGCEEKPVCETCETIMVGVCPACGNEIGRVL